MMHNASSLFLLFALFVVWLDACSAIPFGSANLDLYGDDLTIVNASSPLGCAQMCDGHAACQGWAWDSCGKSRCWLKASIEPRTPNLCRVSGVKLGQVGIDRLGNDLGSPVLLPGGATASTCASACVNTSRCVAWSFDTCGKSQCWLKGAIPTTPSHNTCRTSGIQGSLGLDHKGSDMLGSPVTLPNKATATDCASLCSSSLDCLGWAFVDPKAGCELTNICWLKTSTTMGTSPDPCRISGMQPIPAVPVHPNATLAPPRYRPMPLGSILPQGWLLKQLRTQGDGLSGHLSEFWPDISSSAWIGNSSGDSFERVPYWLNGMVPLSALLKDPELQAQAYKYIDYVLRHEQDPVTGWLGPTCCDVWPRIPFLLAMIQYAEANATDTQRIVNSLHAFFKGLGTIITQQDSLSSWAQFRYQDLLVSIYWLYDHHPLANGPYLLDLAALVKAQGFDWESYFAGDGFPTTGNPGIWTMQSHGVNNGQAIKSAAMWYRQSRNSSLVESSMQRHVMLDKYHGQASGIFACDECLAGKMPSQGTELCTVVETMYSYNLMASVLANVEFADRVEKLTFNSLPATFTPDMWAHQYLQQSNEINAGHFDPNVYGTDGPDSNIYGLAPNYGCCTANFNQGWPKFTSHLYMFSPSDNGLVALTYAPSSLSTYIRGKPVSVTLVTEYPFDTTLTFMITSGATEFPFHFRIPTWAKGATLQIGSGVKREVASGTFAQVNVTTGTLKVTLDFPMSFSIERRYNNAASVLYGPLVFALQMGESWKQLAHYAFNSNDWQCLPTQPWGYALLMDDDDHPEKYLKLVTRPMGQYPFSLAGSPFVVHAQGRAVPSWNVTKNAASPPPTSPVHSSEPLVPLTLYPFGATKLRIAEIPTLA
eukprot:TRINITY_DN1137_c0_g1_i3.p1 TRINITY_DN1137_c0_g1~~TRINITY_DN1137_c0_g1_i3.p1  ORF type:complete len:891 (+),score=93.98 TRINITY_DN1137_c0_g1_i3:45-2675(+)